MHGEEKAVLLRFNLSKINVEGICQILTAHLSVRDIFTNILVSVFMNLDVGS